MPQIPPRESWSYCHRCSLWDEIAAYDAYIKTLADYKKAQSDARAASQAEADSIRDFSEELGALMGLGRSGGMLDIKQYIGKDAGVRQPLDQLLGLNGTEEEQIEAKVKKLADLVHAVQRQASPAPRSISARRPPRCSRWLPPPFRGPEAQDSD